MSALGVSAPALACTMCNSAVATSVRLRLFEADFATNLLAVAAPAPILFGFVYLASRIGRNDIE